MKISIIDVGSNSVRLALMADGKTLYKRLATTRLGEGLSFSCKMKPEAIERTAQAISSFIGDAERDGAQKIYVFATAAVRSAENSRQFLDRVKELCGIDVDVISGGQEAKIGLLGALKGADGGIIDVGGASTEVTVRRGGKTIYTRSVNIGTVRLKDLAGRNREKLEEIISEKLAEYGNFDASDCGIMAIGGTASRLGAIKHGLTEYRPEVIDGTVITLEEMYRLADRLLTEPISRIRATTICKNSADVVGGGCLLMLRVMERFGADRVTVSESDNIEGYYLLKEGRV